MIDDHLYNILSIPKTKYMEIGPQDVINFSDQHSKADSEPDPGEHNRL